MTSFKGFALLAILATAVVMPAFAQTDTAALTVETDKASYNDGETITISGTSSGYISGVPVTIVITEPNFGNRVLVDQIDLGTDNTFSKTITAGGIGWKAAGTYTIKAQYGGETRTAETTFEFSGSTGVTPSKTLKVTIDGKDYELEYSITGGKVTDIQADQSSATLTVSISTTADGSLTIKLPRAFMDAKINDEDDDYFVLIDGQEVEFTDDHGSDTRTLEIPFNNDGDIEIEIIGTWMVPEFGAIAAVVLAIAIISIIAVSAKTRLMPKY